jgi:histidine ammonia-lyase
MTIVRLDGEHLTPEDVLAVARNGAKVELASAGVSKVERSRAVVERLLESNTPVYGLNTGFGSLRDIHINSDQTRELQRNLIRSHCCGVGDPAPEDVVRAMMLLRANTLVKGYSGVRPVVIQALVKMLNKRIYPHVPMKGSVGASGDLAPLSHLALTLMGEGKVYLPSGKLISAARALKLVHLTPIELEAKEGLALNNGTQFTTAVGVLAFLDAEYLAHLAIHSCALSVEAMQGVQLAFDQRIHQVRNQIGQIRVAAMLRKILQGSELLAAPVNFGALNGAYDSLEKAVSCLQDDRKPHLSDSDVATANDIITRIDHLRVRIQEKRDSFVKGNDATDAVGAKKPAKNREDLRRLEANREFQEDVVEVERIYDRVFSLTSDYGWAEARKHLQHALERLQEVVPQSPPIQDDYCLRCAPQVIGASLDTLWQTRAILTRELNAATDNPLIFPPDLPHLAKLGTEDYVNALSSEDCRRAVVSGGNFHAAPIALTLDQCCVAVAALGNIAERRIFHLTTGRLSNGLPRFLTPYFGLQSGMMIAQVTAASLVSENKTLCHPASADSIPTVEDAEDHVSMGAFAARKFAEVVKNVRWVIAIELICATQGIGFRQPARPSPMNGALLGELMKHFERVTEDRPLSLDIERVTEAIRKRQFATLEP